VVVKEHTQTVTVTSVRTVTATTRTGAAEPTIYVDTLQGLLYKPDSMSYYGGAQVIEHIRWLSYGGAVAIGKAEFGRDDCNPDCATGRYTYTPITVKLMDRQRCHGATAYDTWSLRGAGLDPAPATITDPDSAPCE
jgi:hypothetical protein